MKVWISGSPTAYLDNELGHWRIHDPDGTTFYIAPDKRRLAVVQGGLRVAGSDHYEIGGREWTGIDLLRMALDSVAGI